MDILFLLQISALFAGVYSQSYSQVRYASTRRNGTAYDPYSVLSNPALANHRLPVYPQQPTTPLPPLPVMSTTLPPVAAMDAQSAVQDAIQQGNFNPLPYFGSNHLMPQHTDTLIPDDLQQAPSQVHQVRLPAITTTETSDMLEERIRDYFHRRTEVVPPIVTEPTTTTRIIVRTKATSAPQNALPIMSNKPAPAPLNTLSEPINRVIMSTSKPEDKTNFTAPATNELFSINDALVHQQKPPIEFGSAPNRPPAVPSVFTQQQVINRPPGTFAMPPQGFPASVSNLNIANHPALPPGAVLIDPNRVSHFHNQPQGSNIQMNAGISFNTRMPQGSNVPSNSGMPQLQSISSNSGMPQLPSISSNSGRPQLPSIPNNSGRPQLPSISSNSRMPQLPSIPNNSGRPQLPSIPNNSGMSQLPISTGHMNSGSNIAFNPQMQPGSAINPSQNSFVSLQSEPNRRVNVLSNDQAMLNSPQNAQGTIPGPMGIHIPIPPKSVPAHSVMGPPMAMPPMQNGNGMPVRKNGGFLDSIKNFFTGFNNNRPRARFLDDSDDGMLIIDDENNSTVIDELNISNETSENSTEVQVPTVEDEIRVKREVEGNETTTTTTATVGNSKNKTKTLLDEIGSYLRKTIHRLREETEKIASPLWPTIRNTVRTYFASSKPDSTTTLKPEIEDLERRSAEKNGFWSKFLDDEMKKDNIEDEKEDLEKDIKDFLKSEELKKQSMEQLKLVAATSMLPRCSLDTQNKHYCLEDNDYPTNLLKQAIQQDDSAVACNTTLGRSLLFEKISAAKPGACLSPIHKVTPLRAKNQAGVWKLIINIDSCQQTVHIQKCHPSCATRTSTSAGRGHCKEVYASYKLFAFDSKHGFHQDEFQFPSACWCGS